LNEYPVGELHEFVPLIPKQAAIAVGDLVDNCAKVKPGMNVLLVYNDGVYGGVNIVDWRFWLHWRSAESADATGFAISRIGRWFIGAMADPGAWHFSPIVAGAMKSADCIISNAVDLTFEEELRCLRSPRRKISSTRAIWRPLVHCHEQLGLTLYELISRSACRPGVCRSRAMA
jgi:hypothetical protein